MDTQQDIGFQISESNQPLLVSIQQLEDKVFSLEQTNQTLLSRLKVVNDERTAQTLDEKQNLAAMSQKLAEERRINNEILLKNLKKETERKTLLSKLAEMEEKIAVGERTRSDLIRESERRVETFMEELRASVTHT